MSDIGEIRKALKPWTGRDGQERYYVNDWKARLGKDLLTYLGSGGVRPSSGGKVWYDRFGHAHADRFDDDDLARFIENTMERTQFLKPGERAEHPFEAIDWTAMIGSVPHSFKPEEPGSDIGVEVFRHGGREFYIEGGYLKEQMESNGIAYRDAEGRIYFESEASDLTELVKALVGTEPEPEDCDDDHWLDSPIFDDYVPLEEALEDWALPRSRWTKGKVLDCCRTKGVPKKAMDVLNRMKLEDILNCFLLDAGVWRTGSYTDADRTRHTRFYLLDLESIKNLGRWRSEAGRILYL